MEILGTMVLILIYLTVFTGIGILEKIHKILELNRKDAIDTTLIEADILLEDFDQIGGC